jgi:uncharacterized membrane protein YhhN
MTFSSAILALLCLAFAAAYVVMEWRGGGWRAWAAKTVASTCFVALAVHNNAFSSNYGIFVLGALALSWIGDILLLSPRGGLLLAGIAAFLLAHIAFAIAFATLTLDPSVFVAALTFWNVAALLLIRWLWKYLAGTKRIAVIAYLAVITVVAALAFATGSPIISSAAAFFAVSDISVARDRFVKRSIANRAWGIPLYYLAQVLFAMSLLPTLR